MEIEKSYCKAKRNNIIRVALLSGCVMYIVLCMIFVHVMILEFMLNPNDPLSQLIQNIVKVSNAAFFSAVLISVFMGFLARCSKFDKTKMSGTIAWRKLIINNIAILIILILVYVVRIKVCNINVSFAQFICIACISVIVLTLIGGIMLLLALKSAANIAIYKKEKTS